MTVDQALAQLSQLNGGQPLSTDQIQRASAWLQSQGWQGGDVSDQHFSALAGALQQERAAAPLPNEAPPVIPPYQPPSVLGGVDIGGDPERNRTGTSFIPHQPAILGGVDIGGDPERNRTGTSFIPYVPPTETMVPGPLPGCFPAGTRITTPTGPKAIEAVQLGDVIVLSHDGSLGTVTDCFAHAQRPLIAITHDGGVLRVTGEHPIWRAGAFVPAKDLVVGDRLLAEDGDARVIRAIDVAAPADVYNFTVTPGHTYFADGIWVHNKTIPAPPPEGTPPIDDGGRGIPLPSPTPTPAPTTTTFPGTTPVQYPTFTYQPFTQQFQAPAPIQRFQYDPWTHQFQAPEGLTEENDPGWRARMKLGSDAIQRSAAARGTLLTGGTLRSLMDYGQTFASNEYGNVYNRSLGEYQQARSDYDTNRANAFQAWAANAGLSQQERDQAWQQYVNAQEQHNLNQQVPFNQQLSLAQLQQQGSIAGGQLGLGYAQLGENARQANQGLQYNYAGLNENARQADNSMGFNYANLGENSRQFGANLGENARQADNALGYNYWNAGNQNNFNWGQLQTQNNQFNANLGYQYAGLGENSRQFNQNLGYNYWNSNNQNALGYANLNANNQQFYSGLNANQGLGYAQLLASIYGTGAQQYIDALYGGANARAGGQAASGTNWANLFSNIGTGVANYYGYGSR